MSRRRAGGPDGEVDGARAFVPAWSATLHPMGDVWVAEFLADDLVGLMVDRMTR